MLLMSHHKWAECKEMLQPRPKLQWQDRGMGCYRPTFTKTQTFIDTPAGRPTRALLGPTRKSAITWGFSGWLLEHFLFSPESANNLLDHILSNHKYRQAECLIFADLQWFNFTLYCSNVEVYPRVCLDTVTSLLCVFTGARERASAHKQWWC